MRENNLQYEFEEGGVISRASDERGAFIRRTYAHLAGSILAFVALEALLIQLGLGEVFLQALAVSPYSWLVVLVVFIGAGYVAQMWARSDTSRAVQYAGLGLYIVIEAIIFLPMIYIAANFASDDYLIQKAGILTLAVFGGLSITAFITKKDFSFLGPALSMGMLIALGVIVAGIMFGFTLGLFFCFAMVALVSGYILYDTSNIIHHYRTDQHVAASLALFADVALLFWYILRILWILQDR